MALLEESFGYIFPKGRETNQTFPKCVWNILNVPWKSNGSIEHETYQSPCSGLDCSTRSPQYRETPLGDSCLGVMAGCTEVDTQSNVATNCLASY